MLFRSFGIGEESTLHFDQMVASLVDVNLDAYAALSGWDESYATAWDDDLGKTDSLGVSIADRVSMFNPLYYSSGHYDGYGTAQVAPHWRINEGVFDTENSLRIRQPRARALALQRRHRRSLYPVWGQGHVLAERTGTATANLVSWVTSCCASA